jgi:hypothetical protein
MHVLNNDKRIRDLISNKFIWPEQQFLTMWFQKSWTSINPIFLGLQGYPSWKVLYGVQYAGEKPWTNINSKVPMVQKVTYSDFQIWHKLYRMILKQNPDLVNNSVLKDANDFHDEFVEIFRLRKCGIINEDVILGSNGNIICRADTCDMC